MSINRTNLKTRVPNQQEKFIDNKRRGLANAIKNSGQSTTVYKLFTKEFEQMKFNCLINSDKLSIDYDNKMISLLEKDLVKAGDVFYWPDSDSYWLITLRESGEKSYFKGYLRECQSSIVINEIEYPFWISNNPTNFTAGWIKGSIALNNPEKDISLLITKNEDTLSFFKNNEIIKWNSNNWEVLTSDDFSTEGILEVILTSAPNNKYEDLLEEEVKEIEIQTADKTKPYITGKSVMSPFESAEYTINAIDNTQFLKWNVSSNKIEIITSNNSSVLIKDTSGKSNQFQLEYILQDNSIAAQASIEVESF